MVSIINIRIFILLLLFVYNFAYSENILDLKTNGFDFQTALNNTSKKCQDQISRLNQSTLLRLFDASAKLPSGLLIPYFYHLGRFDECYSIQYESDIYGKYCLGTRPEIKLPDSTQNLTEVVINRFKPQLQDSFNPVTLHLGYCLVDGCTVEDFQTLFSWMKFNENKCYTKPNELELSVGAIATITILSIFLALVVLSTLYEIWLYYAEKKNPYDFLVAFSAFSNGKKLIHTSNNPNQLPCLNGLKAISMIWVVLFHEYMHAYAFAPVNNWLEISQWGNQVINSIITQGSVSVDTFFTISGILVVYTVFRTMDRTHEFKIIQFYLHRYIRLTPLVAIMVLMHAELIQYLGNGPLWSNVYDVFVKDCENYWWSALLYIQNFITDNGTCVPQTWYLTVDFQLYLLSPIVLLTLRKSRKIGYYLLGVLITLSFVLPIVLTWIYGIQETFFFHDQSEHYEGVYYKKTYTRFGPYVLGMLTGYYIYNFKKSEKKLKLSNYTVLAAWCVSLLTLLACLFGPYDIVLEEEFTWKDAIANGFVRNAWSIGLCIIIILCITGYGGPIDWFLSLPIFQIISKLSYSIYLVHYWVICIRYLQAKDPIVFSNTLMMWSFWGDFALSTALAIIFYLAFESPMLILERYILPNHKRSTEK